MNSKDSFSAWQVAWYLAFSQDYLHIKPSNCVTFKLIRYDWLTKQTSSKHNMCPAKKALLSLVLGIEALSQADEEIPTSQQC